MTSTEIKNAVSKVLGIEVKFLGIKKNNNMLNISIKNEWFCLCQNNKITTPSWRKLSHLDYIKEAKNQALQISEILGHKVEYYTNVGNFNVYNN